MLQPYPISFLQFWLFSALALVFFGFILRAARSRSSEAGSTQDNRSRLGIILQSIGIGLAGFGAMRPTLSPLDSASLFGCSAVAIFMGGAIYLFAASSRALGQNWSIVARTRSGHQLVRNGPYARVRHPIYLGMLLFLLGLTAALGHWFQLLIAVPVFLVGTGIRTRIEEQLLEQRFGEEFRNYRASTPALFPRLS